MAYRRKVLSIDGGGIRGIIPAMILAEIEERTGKRIADLFDLIAGTSTGGILALGLTKPHPQDPSLPHFTAAEIATVYEQRGREIFDESLWGQLLFFLDDLCRSKYSPDGRDRVLKEVLGNTPLSSAIKEVLLTSYDIDNRFPVFFTSDQRKEETVRKGKQTTHPSDCQIHGSSITPEYGYRKVCNGFTMHQAAMATSAAPTYFQPYRLPTGDKTRSQEYVLVDGGVFANNPTALAIIEMIGTYCLDMESKGNPETRLPVDEILVVSLGTGSLTRSFPYKKARHWGILGWIRPLINITLDGTSEVVAVQLDQLLSECQLYRFQEYLIRGSGSDELDKADPDNIRRLKKLAKKIIHDRQQDIEKLCKLLLTPNCA